MKKEIYIIEVEELVFLKKAKQKIRMLVTKQKLIELLDGNYKVYSASLVAEEDLEKYLNLGDIWDAE